MPSHAEVAARMLDNAATFYANFAAHNPDVRIQMVRKSEIYKAASEALPIQPVASATAAAKLLREAAAFFRMVAEKNPPIQELMAENADLFEQMAGPVESDPLGQME